MYYDCALSVESPLRIHRYSIRLGLPLRSRSVPRSPVSGDARLERLSLDKGPLDGAGAQRARQVEVHDAPPDSIDAIGTLRGSVCVVLVSGHIC